MNRNLKSRIQRLERQMQSTSRGTAAGESLRRRLAEGLKRVAQDRENQAEEEKAA